MGGDELLRHASREWDYRGLKELQNRDTQVTSWERVAGMVDGMRAGERVAAYLRVGMA